MILKSRESETELREDQRAAGQGPFTSVHMPGAPKVLVHF